MTIFCFASKIAIKDQKIQNIFLYKICFIISLFSVPAPLCFGSQQGHSETDIVQKVQ